MRTAPASAASPATTAALPVSSRYQDGTASREAQIVPVRNSMVAERAAKTMMSNWAKAGPVRTSAMPGSRPSAVSRTPKPLRASDTAAVMPRNHHVEASDRSLSASVRSTAVIMPGSLPPAAARSPGTRPHRP